MKLFLKTFLLVIVSATCGAQTIKSLGYNTTNGQVAYSGTNTLRFTNEVRFNAITFTDGVDSLTISGSQIAWSTGGELIFGESRFAVNNDSVWDWANNEFRLFVPLVFENSGDVATTLTNLGLSPSSVVSFAGLTNNGDITINQTATNNGLLYIYRTNSEPFLGLANLIASNNTTISNETLFRVGVSEATNKAAQFGFRSTNTNGNGVAVFSVFGFNALMMVGADALTNAVIYSGGGTNNEVMTLIRDGATEFARPIRFSTNAASKPSTNAPANTTNVAAWVEFRIGTNSYRAPLYQ